MKTLKIETTKYHFDHEAPPFGRVVRTVTGRYVHPEADIEMPEWTNEFYGLEVPWGDTFNPQLAMAWVYGFRPVSGQDWPDENLYNDLVAAAVIRLHNPGSAFDSLAEKVKRFVTGVECPQWANEQDED